MGTKYFPEELIAYALRWQEAGTPVREADPETGDSEQTLYRRKRKFAAIGVAELRRLKEIEEKNPKPKQMVADMALDKRLMQGFCSGDSLRVYGHSDKIPEQGREPHEPSEVGGLLLVQCRHTLVTFDPEEETLNYVSVPVMNLVVPPFHLSTGMGTDTHPHLHALRRGPDRFAVGLAALHQGPHDVWLLRQMKNLAAAAGIPLVASNRVLYHAPARRHLQDVLAGIRLGRPGADLGEDQIPSGERHLKPGREMLRLWPDDRDAVIRTVELADRCSFSLGELRYDYPEQLCPPGETPLSFLTRITREGARDRYPTGIPEKVRQQVEHELRLIEDLRYGCRGGSRLLDSPVEQDPLVPADSKLMARMARHQEANVKSSLGTSPAKYTRHC